MAKPRCDRTTENYIYSDEEAGTHMRHGLGPQQPSKPVAALQTCNSTQEMEASTKSSEPVLPVPVLPLKEGWTWQRTSHTV